MAAPKKDEKEKLAPIIIKRVKKGGGGHHGGAWKVAYADFVTAMMAFFLLLWLLNVTTEEQKNAISNYFDPSHPKVSDVTSGAGGMLAGATMSPVGAMVSTVQPIVQPDVPDTTTRGEQQGQRSPGEPTEEELETKLKALEDARFKEAEAKLKAEIANSPELKDLADNLIIDITPEGLRIQIVDDKGRSMFPSGSAKMYDFMRLLLLKVTSVITPLPNQVSVRGHTDAQKYRDPSAYDNWNLSADRAQASRRVMVSGGLPEKRIENVMGRADREHLVPKEPEHARNRRISIILLRERLTRKPGERPKLPAAAQPEKPQDKKPGLQIIDDTKPAAPALGTTPGTTPGAAAGTQGSGAQGSGPVTGTTGGGTGGAPAAEQPPAPLPTTRTPATFRRQPQVMYFGERPSQDSLYQGPAQSPYTVPAQNKPPTIRTPVFKLDDAPKTITFDETPAPPARPAAPATLPPAPADLQLVNPPARQSVTPPASSGLPPAPADLQLVNPPAQQSATPPVNPNLSPRLLEFDSGPAPAAPAAAPAATPGTTPAPAAPDAAGRELTFD